MVMSDARVREIFTEFAAEIEQKIGGVLVENFGKANTLAPSHETLAERVKAQVVDSDARVTQNVVELNTTKSDLEAVFLSRKNKFAEVDMQRESLENYSTQMTACMNETRDKNNADTDARFKVLIAELNAYATSMETRLAAEFDSTKKFVTEIEDRIRRTGVAGGTDTGGHAGKKSKLTTKDCPVMKMQEKINMLEFRQWMVTVELQLESAHDMAGVDKLFEKLRFVRDPITRETYTAMLAGLDGDFEFPITASPAWEFDATTRLNHVQLHHRQLAHKHV